jgi:hypothetical protein
MPDNTQVISVESVDRIRDIIFGPKMRDYEQRFDAILRDLDRLQQELDHLGDQLTAKDAVQGKNLQALRQELRQADTEVRNELKAESGRLQGQQAEQNKVQTAGVQALRQELRQADADVRGELKAEAARLGSEQAQQAESQHASLEAARAALVQTGAEQAATFQAGLDGVCALLAEHETNQKNTLQTLRQELRKADSEVLAELRSIAQRLVDEKPDRQMLGDLFVELGNHVKTGGSLADIIKGLDQGG